MARSNLRINVEEVLKHSFRNFHAKGLDYICLRRSEEETWKLYFFEGDVSRSPEVVFPHDHRYNFMTYVLSGTVENVLYKHVDGNEGEPYNRFHWRTPLNPGPSGFSFQTTCRLKEIDRSIYVSGQEYPMCWSQIHTIRIAHHDTVLFLKQYEDAYPIGVPSNTYSRGDAPKTDGLYQRFDTDSLLAKLSQFEKRLGIHLSSILEF